MQRHDLMSDQKTQWAWAWAWAGLLFGSELAPEAMKALIPHSMSRRSFDAGLTFCRIL